MKVLVVSGIWPPDVGGPASHAPEVAGHLLAAGHRVEAVVTADAPPPPAAHPVRFVPRRLPVGVRHLAAVALIARRARRADVVYTTGMFGRTALACALVRVPYVVKLTADPAFERSRNRRLVAGDVDEFQRGGGGAVADVLRRARDLTLTRAAFVLCPSAYLRDLAVGWGVDPARVDVLPNPAPALPDLPSHEDARARLGLDGTVLAFAGRLTAQKSLGLALEAVAAVDGVSLLLAGEGPEREALERRAAALRLDGRVRFLGPQPREAVLELFRAADASILTSAWENFPHAVVEALAAGTPLIATATGGVAEVVRDGENGLLVPSGDLEALVAALTRFRDDEALRRRLRERAAPSVEAYAPERVYGRLASVLAGAAEARG